MVILHYVGHGGKNLNGELELCGLSGKVITVERLLNNIQTNQIIALEEHVGIAVVLDCCFAFLPLELTSPTTDTLTYFALTRNVIPWDSFLYSETSRGDEV